MEREGLERRVADHKVFEGGVEVEFVGACGLKKRAVQYLACSFTQKIGLQNLLLDAEFVGDCEQ